MTKKTTSDITVYGATGFVAKHVLRYLIEASKHIDNKKQKPQLRVGLGGRSRAKLDMVKEDLIKTYSKDVVDAVIHNDNFFIADGSDLAKLTKMAQSSHVILNCAGPYAKYSSGVVAACVHAGTDYVDITGEVDWVAKMRQTYGPQNKISSTPMARIVSFCGYDSIPSDMALFAAVQVLREKVPSAKIEAATIWHQTFAMPNGGTIHTALDMPLDFKRDFFLPSSTEEQNKGSLRKVPFFMGDPLSLTHPEQVRYNPEYESTKNQFALAEWWNSLLVNLHSDFSFGISVPMPMAAVNMKILNASSIALQYGSSPDDKKNDNNNNNKNQFVKVKERFLPLGFVATQMIGILGIIPAMMFQFGLLCTIIIAKLPIIGRTIANFVAPPGSGVPDSISSRGSTAVYATATTPAKEESGAVDRGFAYLSWQGDAGNFTTAQCVSEAALALVLDREDLPEPPIDGFGTPAEIFGTVLLKRFRECKVRPVQVKTMVRTNAKPREMKLYINEM
eukprot:scaffold4916_cov111-Cylindrotheca_fusiformis.AAC.4